MPTLAPPELKPRKTPLQERSTSTVEAILQATVQVLLAVGKENLTTTRVAQRAGVSVGTLYQYFPNKSALLQAVLKRHVDEASRSILRVCKQHESAGLLTMANALIEAFMAAKMGSPATSAALYAISSDVDGAAIAKAATARSLKAVTALFATANEGLTKDPALVASIVVAALNGVSRRLLEAKHPERDMEPLRRELIVLVHAYLRTCTAERLT